MTAAKVIDGRRRNATATGTRKNASRACEKAPPESSGEHADRRDVDGGRRERELLAGRPEVHPGEHARAPRREERERDEEPRLLGFGCARPWPSAISAIAGQPQPGDDSLGLRGRFTVRRGEGRAGRHLFDQAASHRTRNRGGAVRDAQLLVQVLNVGLHGRQPQVQLLRNLGQALARGDQVEDLLLTRGQRRRVVLLAQPDLRDEARRRPRGGTTFSPRAQASTASAICSRRASFEMKPAAPVSSAL